MKAALARKTVGAGSLWIFAVTASSPMTVMVGGIVTTFAYTGVVGVPLSFLVLAVALTPLMVAYVSAARHVPHAASIYAVVAHGLGSLPAVCSAALALLAYNAIQISLYGLLGTVVAGIAGGPWWLWAALAWAGVAVAGVLHVRFGAGVLGVVLVCQLVLIVWFDVVALTGAPDGLSLAGLNPASLFGLGVGGAFAFGMAAFIGFESPATYAEEARSSRSVGTATYLALGFLGVFYGFSAWAMTVATGPDQVVAVAQDPGAGLPFAFLGGVGSTSAGFLLIGAILAAMLSFHNGVARYAFAFGRERVLPGVFARIRSGMRGGAPVGGSVLQSGIAAAVIAVTAVTGLDPFAVMFTWLSTIAAMAVLVLLTAVAVASMRFFARGGGAGEGPLVRRLAPLLGVGIGAAILATMVANEASLLGIAADSGLRFVPPAVIVATILLGVVWGLRLRRRDPDAYRSVGRGRPHPLAIPDQRLAGVVL